MSAPEPAGGGVPATPGAAPSTQARFRRHSALLLGGQLLLLGGGYLVHLFVGRTLGPRPYGSFGLVAQSLFLAEVALYGGFLLAIPRVVSARPGVARGLLLRVGAGIVAASAALWGGVGLAAGPIARALGDEGIAPLFPLAFMDLLPFCLYNVCVGVLDGFSAFERRTACAVVYMTVKVAAMLALLATGFGVAGALVGNVVGSVVGLAVILPAAWRLSGSVRPESRRAVGEAVRQVLRQAAPAGAFAVCVQAMLSVDLFVLGHTAADRELVGLYQGAATLAKAPYFLLSAQAAVLVPMVATALARGDEEGRSQAAGHIRRELRFAILLLLPSLAVVVATAPETVAFAMGETFRPAAPILPALVAGLMCFGLFRALATAAMAGQRNAVVLGLLVGAVALDVALCFALVPRFGMVGAALATLATASAAAGAALLYLRAVFAYTFPWGSLARIGLAASAGLAASWAADAAGLPVVLSWASGGAAIALGLLLTGEVRIRPGRGVGVERPGA